MARISDIVEAIAVRLESFDGLQVYRAPVLTIDATPAAVVTLAPGAYDSTMTRDSDDMVFVIDLFATMGPEGMDRLYAYVDGSGDESIIELFDNDSTLGGVVEFIEIAGWDKPNIMRVGAGDFYHIEMMSNVGARGQS